MSDEGPVDTMGWVGVMQLVPGCYKLETAAGFLGLLWVHDSDVGKVYDWAFNRWVTGMKITPTTAWTESLSEFHKAATTAGLTDANIWERHVVVATKTVHDLG